jgi:hypothetical protein
MHDELSSRGARVWRLSDLAVVVSDGPKSRAIAQALITRVGLELEASAKSGSETEFELVSRSGSHFELSTVSRRAAVYLLTRAKIPLPKELSEPQSLEEANEVIRQLTAALERSEARLASSPSQPSAEPTTSKIGRTTLLLVAALALELCYQRGPKYCGADGRPNVSSVATDIANRLTDVHGASHANIRARLSLALSQYRADVGDAGQLSKDRSTDS